MDSFNIKNSLLIESALLMRSYLHFNTDDV